MQRKISWLPIWLCLFFLASCGTSGGIQTGSTAVQIDWMDFVKFGGITYLQVEPGRLLTQADRGKAFATVNFEVSTTVTNPNYQIKNGDAARLKAGTQLYMFNGYQSSFRLIAQVGDQLLLYEVDTNPSAKTGADLLDIANKVNTIDIVSDQDGKTVLGTIKNADMITSMVTQIIHAPVQQAAEGNIRYLLVFHLHDGTEMSRMYWLDTGELSRGIMLPSAFGTAVKQAL